MSSTTNILIKAEVQLQYAYTEYVLATEYVLLQDQADIAAFRAGVPRCMENINGDGDEIELTQVDSKLALTLTPLLSLMRQTDLWDSSSWKREQVCCVCGATWDDEEYDHEAQCHACLGFVCREHELCTFKHDEKDYCEACMERKKQEFDSASSHKITDFFTKK